MSNLRLALLAIVTGFALGTIIRFGWDVAVAVVIASQCH